MVTVEPVDQAQRRCITEATGDYVRPAGDIFAPRVGLIPVVFDLTGRFAGIYRVTGWQRQIRYNPHIFSCYRRCREELVENHAP